MSPSKPLSPASRTGDTTIGWERRSSWAVGLLLLVSLGLRVWLAATGGQGFWPDESRYGAARGAVSLFARGDSRAAWGTLIGTADHLFFKISGLPVAWWEFRHGQNPVLVAVY